MVSGSGTESGLPIMVGMDQYVLIYVVGGVFWAAMVVRAHRKRHTLEEWQQRWAPLVGPEATKALYQESVVRRTGTYSGAAMSVTIVIGIASHVKGAAHVVFAVMLCATFLAMAVATFVAPKRRQHACAYASDRVRVKVHPSAFPPCDASRTEPSSSGAVT
jgi:hypothetical protein